MAGRIIPFNHAIARHCRASEMAYGPDGQPSGIYEAAFRPRPTDLDGVSVIWVDFFSGPPDHQLNCVRSVVTLKVTSTQRMALIRVGSIHTAISSGGGTPSVTEDPCDDLPPNTNAAHALIGPIDTLSDKAVREAIASSVRPSDIVSYKLTP